MRVRLKTANMAAISLIAMLGLTGCSFNFSVGSNPDSVSPDKVERLAEDLIEEQVGIRPIVDCGTEDIKLIEGETRDCLTTDPTTDEVYETVVTMTDVDTSEGTFLADVQVADAPLP